MINVSSNFSNISKAKSIIIEINRTRYAFNYKVANCITQIETKP